MVMNTGIRNAFILLFILLSAAVSGGCGRSTQSYLASAQEAGAGDGAQGASRGAGAGNEPQGANRGAGAENGTGGADRGAGAGNESGGADETESGGTVLVYICGEVAKPGVYELPEGSRIFDAVEAAGGMTEEAAEEYWNLAEPLTDGRMVCFPTEEEAAKGQVPAGAQQSGSSGITEDGRVNINTAGLEELMTIPGVGQTRGEAIIAYRQEHGGFQEPQDIKKVPGIGDTLYERMSGSIAVK